MPILLFLSFFIGFLVTPTQTYASSASDNFIVASIVTYTVSEDGMTHVVINSTLTNTTSNNLASKFGLELGFPHLNNIEATDPTGAVPTEVDKTETGNTIIVSFKARVVGKGNQLPFSISFDTPDAAQKEGRVWELNIPGLSKNSDFEEFTVRVQVPESFGQPSFIKPKTAVIKENNEFVFTKEQLQNSGISFGFGQTQTYEFTLLYHIKNSNLFPVRTEIALPPDTNYQTSLIDNISPKPFDVIQDEDGNWLAQYHLLPSEEKDITVKGQVALDLTPQQSILIPKQRDDYTKPQTYWQTTNQTIQILSHQLQTPQAIYDYVVKTLSYDFSRVSDNKPRVGAVGVLSNPSSAVCLEFTDLFIALARANGIPAREIDGFAYTQNTASRPLSLEKDILHAWPEYYDDTTHTWMMVDPTWGNTTRGVDYFNTLDFDHVAFVIKGKENTYPVPAGGYKLAGQENTKDIQMEFATALEDPLPKVQMRAAIPDAAIAGFPIVNSITLTNVGNAEVINQPVTILPQILTPRSQNIVFTNIPPFGSQSQSFSLTSPSFLTNSVDHITIRIGQTSFLHAVTISPLFLTKWIVLGGVILGILAIIISFLTKRTRRIPVS